MPTEKTVLPLATFAIQGCTRNCRNWRYSVPTSNPLEEVGRTYISQQPNFTILPPHLPSSSSENDTGTPILTSGFAGLNKHHTIWYGNNTWQSSSSYPLLCTFIISQKPTSISGPTNWRQSTHRMIKRPPLQSSFFFHNYIANSKQPKRTSSHKTMTTTNQHPPSLLITKQI